MGNCRAVQEYLLWKVFLVRSDNNPLTYIMTTPNLDSTRHWWVEWLARFTFCIEYQKGWKKAAMDALRWLTSKLDAVIVKSIPDRVTVGTTERADTHNPAVVRNNEEIHKQVQETVILARASQANMNVHVTDWVTTLQEDPVLKTTCWEMMQILRRRNYPLRVEEANTLPESPLPSSNTNRGVERSFAVCSPHGSLIS